MASPLRVHLLSALVALGASVAASEARAETQSESWDVSLTPYVWAAGLSGDVGAVVGAPPTSVVAKFPSLLDLLAGAAMIKGEARYDRFGVLGDLDYLRLAAKKDLRIGNVLALSGKINVKTTSATIAGFWRAYASDRYTADLVAGARYTGVSLAASARANALSASGSATLDGWDPIVGARATMRTGPKGSLAAYGDVGGFGVNAASVWQAFASYNYAFNSHLTGSAGYRALGIDLSRNGERYKATIAGPLFGLTYRF